MNSTLQRDPLDNCLSVYFQQLGGALSYSTNLGDIAHYYRQHERLMSHWQSCMAENIHTVVYEELVRDPETVLRGLLDFLEDDVVVVEDGCYVDGALGGVAG